MRTVEYTRTECHGSDEKVAAPLWVFVYDVPYLTVCDVFPPLHILNQILLSGGDDGGMSPGAIWAPFEITDREFQAVLPTIINPDRQVLDTLARYPDQHFTIDPDLDGVADRFDWMMAVGNKHRHSR